MSGGGNISNPMTIALLAVFILQSPTLTPAERTAFDGIREATIREITTTLASRRMEGRGTGQPGADRAADYLAERMRAYGLAPAGDNGTFFQRIPFVSTEVLPTSTLTAGATRFAYRDDFVVGGRVAADSIDIHGGLAFVGFGRDLRGLDLRGKVALVIQGGTTPGPNAREINDSLMAKGVVAILTVPPKSPTTPYALYAQYLTRRGVRLADGATGGGSGRRPATLVLNEAAAARLASDLPAAIAEARAGTAATRDLHVTVAISIRARVREVTSRNVVGVLRGAGPRAGQAVVFTAHYDAYGIDNGTIYPGAADNALGTAMMLAAAEVAGQGPKPQRSLIFLAVTGEEYGLFGAQYWARQPTWPIDSVAADLNYDGIGTETYGPVTQIVGWGGEFSGLGAVLQDVVSATGNRVIPDPFPEENAFQRSDHYAFVLQGVPALMLLGAPADSGWTHRAKTWLETGDYHQPGDSVRTDWQWSGPRTLAATGLLVGLRAANADAMPAWLSGSPYQRH